MPIKQVKNKVNLYDDLTTEDYIVDEDYVDGSASNIKLNNDIDASINANIAYKNTTDVKSKTKSLYNIFVTKTTIELKNKYPSMTPKERKEELSKLWKLEKEKK
jgi:hypothetical protein